MQNVLATVEEKLSPQAIAAGAPDSLKVGHISYASDLLDGLTKDVLDNTKMSVIQHIAVDVGLTCEEFKKECKKAQEMADTADILSGFVKPEGAKGIEAYGPLRKVLNQRLSEAKQIFGVFKLEPSILAEKGYVAALAAARKVLAELGKNWDGTKTTSAEEKQRALKAERNMTALQETMKAIPSAPGETMSEYVLRVEETLTAIQEKAENEEFLKTVMTIRDKVVEKHGDYVLFALLEIQLTKSTTEQLESLQHWVQEELVIRQLQA